MLRQAGPVRAWALFLPLLARETRPREQTRIDLLPAELR